jgi:PAS domain S-box-containing protein
LGVLRRRRGETKLTAKPTPMTGRLLPSRATRLPGAEETRRGAWSLGLALATLAVCAGYYAGGVLALAVRFPPSGISILWPPNAILLAALLLSPVRVWWVYLLAAIPTHLLVVSYFQPNVPMTIMLCQYAGNVGQAVLAAVAVRPLLGLPPRLDDLRRMTWFIVLAALAAPAVASAFAASLFVSTGWAADFALAWRQRFLNNVVSTLTITPLVLHSANGLLAGRLMSRRRWAELGLITIGLLAVSVPVFVLEASGPGSFPALLFAPLPFLLWAAVRLGPGALSFSLLVVALLSLASAFAGRGPFTSQSPAQNVLSLQVFLLAISAPLMLVAGLVREQHRGQDSLRESEQRYALATAAGGVYVWEARPGGAGIDIDPRFYRALGHAGFEGAPKPAWVDLIHPEDRQRLGLGGERFPAAAEDSLLVSGTEFRVLDPRGHVRWFSSRGMVVRGHGDDAREHVMGAVTEITERKVAEETLRRAQADVARGARVAVMGQLLASISHEINQPLSAIVTNANAALRWLARGPVNHEELCEVLQDVVADGNRASAVIHRLRGLLQNSPVQSRPLDVNDVVREVVAIVRGELIRHRVSLRTDLADDLPPGQADRVQLQQVILNLIVNGVEAMTEVDEKARQLTVRSGTDVSGCVLIAVSDVGVGLDSPDAARIFEPFYTTKPNGIGMGLSICRSIVESHGGRLWAVRNVDRGMTFQFTLPAHAATPQLAGREA